MAEIRIEDIVTPTYLKNTLLVGVDLTDDDGNAYPDDVYEEAIQGAISVVEGALDLTINKTSVVGERHDLHNDQRRAWYGQQLDRRPLNEVSKLQVSYGNYAPVDIPDAWLNITSPRFSSVSLIPTAESIGTFRFNNVLPLLIDPLSNYGQYTRVPAYFKYDYDAGFSFFEETIAIQQGQSEGADISVAFSSFPVSEKFTFKFEVTSHSEATTPRITLKNQTSTSYRIKSNITATNGPITVKVQYYNAPAALIKAILYTAAALPLDIAGDLIAGAGIATIDLDIDGLSQRIDTTSSATNSGYGAKILSYRKQYETAIKSLKRQYKQPKLAAGF